ncbi:cyclodeaminase/cyclohydrolase family protein [Neofamilia massiliensis]|uniref:cyclodeaminase/cyclohydrolase family protein n=1 Tax=Neofamilia massiliensis TaxID=1673724 RepID=UPI0006BB61D7|nr:cyclodeaminase/cyclohydrolase family protein [Neofamilia massiliensis]
MLKELKVEEFVNLTASGEPTPGGGSVSALAGSIGSALNSMVYNLTNGKKVYRELDEEARLELDNTAEKVVDLTEKLIVAMEDDTKAFDGVMEAFKMPKETDEEKKARSAAIQEGYKKAMEVPLHTAKLCLDSLKLMKTMAVHGSINAISDVGVGCLLVYAGLEGSLLNVRINLNSIKDEAYKEAAYKEMAELMNTAKDLRTEVMEIVYDRM